MQAIQLENEWLETDGCGGFASGTVGLRRTRRYHALLLHAVNPPTERFVLINGCEVWASKGEMKFPLSAQLYGPLPPGYPFPNPDVTCVEFNAQPWPVWRFLLPGELQLTCEIFIDRATGIVALKWETMGDASGWRLEVIPLLSGRDYHALHRENPAFNFSTRIEGCRYCWSPYSGVPAFSIATNGNYQEQHVWYRNFAYTQEQARALDFAEDLAAPAIFNFELEEGPGIMLLDAQRHFEALPDKQSVIRYYDALRTRESTRRSLFSTPLHRAAEDYLVRRGKGLTIVAGYPWFTDWGRDTFISIRGLCLATGRYHEAKAILLEWAQTVVDGMVPNRFPDTGDMPEYNSVDAALWFVVSAHELMHGTRELEILGVDQREILQQAILKVLQGYKNGTRYHIKMDEDGLIAAGEPGVQLTWMDAKVGNWVVTPRIGKPVEIQALWINALRIGSLFDPAWNSIATIATRNFRLRFARPDRGLFDVVDTDGHAGETDGSVRPNQIFAVGGLPFCVLDPEDALARSVVDEVERVLWTPLGLRSLSPDDSRYCGVYEGNIFTRDGAYHQGTVWPWLLGPFVEAWVRVRGNTADARALAKMRYIDPLMKHVNTQAGIGHVSEIADGQAPHTPRGCPFQAWSLGELLRLIEQVLK